MTHLPEVHAVKLHLQSGWLNIWFDQPDSRNAMTAALTSDLRNTLLAVREDRTVRGITLAGHHGIFCAGGDLKAFKSSQTSASDASQNRRGSIIELSKEGADLFDLINRMPQVVIVMIEGAAMAGGFGMACCADVVICEKTARFAMTETAIGLSPAQISPYVIQKMGYALARRLMLTAARFNGEQAAAMGFADFVADSLTQMQEIEAQIKKQVLKCAPGAIADTKKLILNIPGMTPEQRVQAAAETFADRMLSDEGKEGVASFVEKRAPYWAAE